MSKLKLGLVGENISKSPSPLIHNYIYKNYDIDASYNLYEIKREEFDKKINDIINQNYGLNITMPYKENVIKFLRGLSDKVEKIKAVNTIKENIGYNTDYLAFKNILSNYEIKNALVLGAGGAARAAIHAIIELNVENLYIFNRTQERALNIIRELNKISNINVKLIKDISSVKSDLIVNTVPIDLNLNTTKIYIDLVYLRKPKEIAPIIIDGYNFLIEQALLSDEIWFNIKFDEEVKKDLRKLIGKNF
ncbi:shikimate 5-dehydrogenase [Caldisphaera lagunensis DSM 15908]|uniref:Shikimate 5-dehydrogenase n=1 Tax=Caldisphaera lagunensis (strain DSM 15908 / JCM 11604 / ANMR 0165 / IC-154) TaxID=1056495 RepID=L0A7Q2_CALLD|nr:shikimate 5-dehydrogenase [Caldisphaera lagunensis]AFZ69898.1 shikimate 5-dehydrogenase [Caldisphaera lagunensis DSM 15908]